jgi:DNA-binding NarL/FixJ family response regulator
MAAHRMRIEQELTPREHVIYQQDLVALHTHLGKTAFAAAQAEGQHMTLDQLLAAREPSSTMSPTSKSAHTEMLPDHLTKREVEVLRLIAQGLTDAQVAEKLGISPRTVNFHLTSIYRKIQVSSRSAATRYAIEHHLA